MRGIYVAGIGPGDGRRLVELGVAELLSRRVERLGVYRTVTRADDGGPDRGLALLRSRYPLHHVGIGVSAREAAEACADDLLTRLAEECEAAAGACDALLVLGGPCTGPGPDRGGPIGVREPAFDARLAAKLGAPVIVVVGGHGGNAEQVAVSVRAAHQLFADLGCAVLAVVANRVPPHTTIEAGLPVPCFLIPDRPALAAPTVRQVAAAARATRLQGDDIGMQADVLGFVFGGATLPVFLDHLTDGALVVTPGDRADLLLGALAADAAGTARPAGVVLTLGCKPADNVRLITSRLAPRMPVLLSGADSFTVAAALDGLRGTLTPEDPRKVETALGHFAAHVNDRVLAGHIGPGRTERITAKMFEHRLVERAVAGRRHIVLTDGEEERVLRAAELAGKRGIAEITLLGRAEVIRRRAHELGLELPETRLVDPRTSPLRDTFADTYALMREHRGMTRRRAHDVLIEPAFFGTMMVHAGIAHGVVGGAVHSTTGTLLPAFQIVRVAPDSTAASAAVFACLADRVVMFADCGLHPVPDAARLADIAVSAGRTADRFGIEPRVALLSYSDGPAGAGGDVHRVRKAAELAHARAPELAMEGPMRYDAAMEGEATVLVFPDLEVADSACRAVRSLPGGVTHGPIVQGLRHPVNDIPAGASAEEIVTLVAMTVVQAQAPLP